MPIKSFDTYTIIYIGFMAVLIGVCMGSFLNCAAIRLANGESVATGRSHCMSCGHTLELIDLVPVVSWVVLGGRCRFCGAPISARYPFTEVLTGLVYVSIVMKYGLTVETAELLILMTALLGASFCDVENYTIPDRFVIIGILARILYMLYAIFKLGDSWLGIGFQSVLGGLSVFLPMLAIVLIMDKVMGRETMGGGDLKLMFMIGLYFPWYVNVFGVLLACIFGIIGAGLAKSRHRDAMIPFGPYIALSAWVVALCGAEVLNWYLGLF